MTAGEESEHRQDRIETEARSRRTSVMLVRGRHFGGAGLKALLLDHPRFRLVADLPGGSGAVEEARRAQPTVILVDADGVDAEAIPLVVELHASAPASWLILFSDDINSDVLGKLAKIPVHGLLAWKDATPEAVEGSIDVIQCGVSVISQTCIAQAFAGAGSKSTAAGVPVVAPIEEAVLQGLLDGKTEQTMAEEFRLGERTVARIVAEVKRKLDADTLFQLGVRAAQTQVLGSLRERKPQT